MATVVIPVSDIRRLIAVLIGAGKIKFIDSFNQNGYPTMYNLTDLDLFKKAYKLFLDNPQDFWKIIQGIDISRTDLNPVEIQKILRDFKLSPASSTNDRNFLETLKAGWDYISGINIATAGSQLSSSVEEVPIIDKPTSNIIWGVGIVGILLLIITPGFGGRPKRWIGRIIWIILIILALLGFRYYSKTATRIVVQDPNTNPNKSNINPSEIKGILSDLWGNISSWWKSKDDSLPKGFTEDACGNVFDETGACFGVCYLPCDSSNPRYGWFRL